MINWSADGGCRRCGAWFGVADYAHGGRQAGQSYAPARAQTRESRRAAGRSRGMRTLRSLLMLIGILGTVGGLRGLYEHVWGTPEWRYYKSERGNFSVQMPTEPEIKTRTYNYLDKLSYTEAVAALTRTQGCSVLYADYPLSIEGITAKQLEGLGRGMAAETDAKVLETRPIRLGSYSGLEMKVKALGVVGDVYGYWRIYLVGSRIYVLVLIGREDGRLLEERDEFFDSFRTPPAPNRDAKPADD